MSAVIADELIADLAALPVASQMQPVAKFPNVSCSQCHQEFGPGDSGFSHCRDHAFMVPQ